uniref:Uncharacterized protein n=1 Tax=Oryza sativa subsp. japonica TaxID=39947 RepID=Q69UB3_ORYSJ|nr:hypothetical protein [Oryza sativa Japonica Group]
MSLVPVEIIETKDGFLVPIQRYHKSTNSQINQQIINEITDSPRAISLHRQAGRRRHRLVLSTVTHARCCRRPPLHGLPPPLCQAAAPHCADRRSGLPPPPRAG